MINFRKILFISIVFLAVFVNQSSAKENLTYNSESGSVEVHHLEEPFTNNTGGTLTAGTVCYINGSGELVKADASAEATAKGMLVILEEDIVNTAEGECAIVGFVDSSGKTAGARYYLSTDAGVITTTTPSGSGEIVRVIGFASNATEIYFHPSQDYIINP